MLNRLYNGEMACKNPAGLPPRLAERIVPRDGKTEQEWWLRSNDRRRIVTDPPFTYYQGNSLKRDNFQAGALATAGEDHSRRVFKELARQGHSFSEANMQALKSDRNLRKDMQKRYWEVMGAAPCAPGPTKPTMRSASGLAASMPMLPRIPESRKAPPSDLQPSPQLERGVSVVSASMPGAASRLSSIAPTQSQVAGSTVSAARMSNVGSAIGGRGMANDMALLAEDNQSNCEPSAVGVSQMSQSDFYAWRPPFLR